ncbi:hypothetical protein [Clostridium sp. ZBS18]|nr:hypothetical protein [Clostridium sp. ZBS18]
MKKFLYGIFEENFSSDEVELSVSNNEFIMDTFDTLRGDVFFITVTVI